MTKSSTACEVNTNWASRAAEIHSMEAFHARNQTLGPVASHSRVMNLLRAMIQCRPKPKPLQPGRERKCASSRVHMFQTNDRKSQQYGYAKAPSSKARNKLNIISKRQKGLQSHAENQVIAVYHILAWKQPKGP